MSAAPLPITPTLHVSLQTLKPLDAWHATTLVAAIRADDDGFAWTNAAPCTVEKMRAWIEARRRPAPREHAFAFLPSDVETGAGAGRTSAFDVDLEARSSEIRPTWPVGDFRRKGHSILANEWRAVRDAVGGRIMR